MERKRILITGCSTGIGRMAAVAFARRGYSVIAGVRHSAMLERFPVEGIRTLELDLSALASVESAVDALAKEGLPDFVIHNAGVGVYGALEDLPRAAMEEQFHANVFGVHQLNQRLLPEMRSRGYGRIVIVTSVLGVVAMRGRGAYVASKFALEGLADTLRLELMGSGVDVSLVEPGPIETHFRANALRALHRYVDPDVSPHRAFYVRFIDGLSAARSTNRFARAPEACLPALFDAIESKAPKARYTVTTPARVFPILKRLLPARWLDRILVKG